MIIIPIAMTLLLLPLAGLHAINIFVDDGEYPGAKLREYLALASISFCATGTWVIWFTR